MESTPPLAAPGRGRTALLAAALLAIAAAAAVAAVAVLHCKTVDHGEMDRQVVFAFKSTLLAFNSARDISQIMKQELPVPNKLDDTGEPLSSWRFQITPYLEFEPRLGGNLKAEWQADVNAAVRRRKPYSYCFLGDEQLDATTNVYAVVGDGTAMDPDRPLSDEPLPPNLIVLMETAKGVHWMAPGDYDVATLLAGKGKLGDVARGVREDRVHVAFADAEVWALSVDTPVEALRPFLTIDSAKSASRSDLRPYQLFMNPRQQR